MSSAQTQIYLELTPELQQLLDDNGLSVGDILRQQNIPVEVTHGVLPDEPEAGAQSKEPVTIILASAAAALLVGSAISQVLNTVFRRPVLVDHYEFVELKDANGNILLDKKGKPQLKRVRRFELLEPRPQDSNQYLDFISNAVNGVVLKFRSTEKQIGVQ